jgi:hypothetical protein
MEVVYSKEFARNIHAIIKFINAINTPNSGERGWSNCDLFIQERLKFLNNIQKCRNNTFRLRNYFCLFYNDWTIALKITEDQVQVVTILHKSRIVK